jgi:hypothetical protein
MSISQAATQPTTTPVAMASPKFFVILAEDIKESSYEMPEDVYVLTLKIPHLSATDLHGILCYTMEDVWKCLGYGDFMGEISEWVMVPSTSTSKSTLNSVSNPFVLNRDPYTCYDAQSRCFKVNLNNVKPIQQWLRWYDPVIQAKAIENNPFSIRFVPEPSEEMQNKAVTKEGYVIKFLPQASEITQTISVTQNPTYIRFIQNPSPDIQHIALSKNPYAINYIENPIPMNLEVDEQIRLVSHDTSFISHIANPCVEVIDLYPHLISGVRDPSIELQLTAVSQDGSLIRYLPNPAKEVVVAALKQNINSLAYIEFDDITTM